MSQSNMELIRSGYERFRATGKFAADITAPGFVWDMSKFRGWPEQQVYAGSEGAELFLEDWRAAWEDWQLEAQAFHEWGDKVVAVMRQRGRSKSTGRQVDMLFAQVWTMDEGLATRMEMYADPEEALQAAGLSASR